MCWQTTTLRVPVGGKPNPRDRARREAGGEPVTPLSFGKKDVRRLERERDIEGLAKLIRSGDEKLAFQAIEALTRLGDGRAVEVLMALVADPSCSEVIRAKAWLALDVGLEREARKRTDWK